MKHIQCLPCNSVPFLEFFQPTIWNLEVFVLFNLDWIISKFFHKRFSKNCSLLHEHLISQCPIFTSHLFTKSKRSKLLEMNTIPLMFQCLCNQLKNKIKSFASTYKLQWSSHLIEPCHQGIFKIWVLWVSNSLDIFGSLTLNTHNFVRRAEYLRYCVPLHLFIEFLVELISNCLLTPTRVIFGNDEHLSFVLQCQTNPLSLITHLHIQILR